MIHNIRVQTWGRRVAIVCTNCTLPGRPETALRQERSDGDATGFSLADIVTVAENHMRDFPDTLSAEDLAASNAAQAAAFGAPDWEGTQVEGQVEFGTVPTLADGSPLPTEEPPLVAYGPPDEFPPGYHPRTGQKLDQGTGYESGSYPQRQYPRSDGGPSVREYLESKGEL